MFTNAINDARSHGVSLEEIGGVCYEVNVNLDMRVYEVWVFPENDDFALLLWNDKAVVNESDWYSSPQDAIAQAQFPRATFYDHVITRVLDCTLALSEWAGSNCDKEGYVKNPVMRALSKGAWNVYSYVAVYMMRGCN